MQRRPLQHVFAPWALWGALFACGSRSELEHAGRPVSQGPESGGKAGVENQSAGGAPLATGGQVTGGHTPGSGGTEAGPCAETPCDSGGRCIELDDSFVCDCRPGSFGERCSTRVVQIEAGYEHACALLSNGTIRCFGVPDIAAISGVSGANDFVSVAVAGICHQGGCYSQSCGIHQGGEVDCWGNTGSEYTVPKVGYAQIALSPNGGCGVQTDATLSCWSSSGTIAINGAFAKVDFSDGNPCALTTTGDVKCWNLKGELTRERVGPYRDIAGNWVLSTDGRLDCLADNCSFPAVTSPTSWMTQRGTNGCAVDAAGRAHCLQPLPDQYYRQLSVGTSLSCGVLQDETARCYGSLFWRGDFRGQAVPPQGTFVDIVAGEANTCGQRPDGTVECWGSDAKSPIHYLESQVVTEPPAQTFSSIALDDRLGCGVRPGGQLECWGHWHQGTHSRLPAGSFRTVFPGCDCALDQDGAPECWGIYSFGAGPYQSLACGNGACGLRTDGKLECTLPPADPPAGKFTELSGGFTHFCALRSSGKVSCWGDDAFGKATPPDASFTNISAGLSHTCGVTSEGKVLCWGSNEVGQSFAKPGRFTRVAAGTSHTCALRTDGTPSCWGEMFY